MQSAGGPLYFGAFEALLGMCNPTIADRVSAGNPGLPFGELEARETRTTPIEGWTGKANRSARRRAARAAEDGLAPADYISASTDGLERRLGILDSSLLKVTDGGSRSTVRRSKLILTDAERGRLRHMARQAESCGSRWGMFRGFESTDAGDFEVRLACQTACGTRACPKCYQKIREREQFRVWGPWNLFFTFTVPRSRASIGDAWREVHLWIEQLVREMRRESRIATIEDGENAALRKPFSAGRRMQARSRVKGVSQLLYAWVLEPHKDGYPHVHMVVDSEWVDFEWLRETWSRAAGVMTAWVYGERVYQIDGACRYLAKYISKAQLSLDILSIMYRRRLWATNLERPAKPEPRWFTEERVTSAEAYLAAEMEDGAFQGKGWEYVAGKPGKYAMWKRPAEEGEGYNFADHWEEQASKESEGSERYNTKHLTHSLDSDINIQYKDDNARIEALTPRYGGLTNR